MLRNTPSFLRCVFVCVVLKKIIFQLSIKLVASACQYSFATAYFFKRRCSATSLQLPYKIIIVIFGYTHHSMPIQLALQFFFLIFVPSLWSLWLSAFCSAMSALSVVSYLEHYLEFCQMKSVIFPIKKGFNDTFRFVVISIYINYRVNISSSQFPTLIYLYS